MARAFPVVLVLAALAVPPALARERGEEVWPGVGRFGDRLQDQLATMGFSAAMSKLATRSRTVHEPSSEEEIVSRFKPNDPGSVDWARLAKPPRGAYKTPVDAARVGPDDFGHRVDVLIDGIDSVHQAIGRVEASLPLPTRPPTVPPRGTRPGTPPGTASYVDAWGVPPPPAASPRVRGGPPASPTVPPPPAGPAGDYLRTLAPAAPTPTPTPPPPAPAPAPVATPEPEPAFEPASIRGAAPPANPDAFLAGLADLLAPLPEAPADPGTPADPAAALVDLEARFPVRNSTTRAQRVRAGLDQSSYTSAADGKSTTDAYYVEHTLDLQRTLGKDRDLYLVNTAKLGSIHDREELELAYTRQYGVEGEGTAGLRVAIQNAKDGEVEPDYAEAELSLAGSREVFPDYGWDFRLYGKTRGYGEVDPFYLDQEAQGLTLGVHGSEDGYNADLRFTFDRERYDQDPRNDVDRRVTEGALWGSLWGFDLRADSSHQREGVKRGTLLDSYDLWATEASWVRRISPVFVYENAYLFETRHVDATSATNFDYRQKARRRKLSARIDAHWDAAFTFTSTSLRNRDKNFLDAIRETFDDQERREWELYLHYGSGRADAVLTLTRGDTDYIRNVASQAFADFDYEAFSLTLGYTFSARLRADASWSEDQTRYPTATINDTSSDALSLSATYSF